MDSQNFLTDEQLLLVLNKIISNNPINREITESNDILKKYGKNILSLQGYLNQMKFNENYKIRQLSAILLNRKLDKHWGKLTDDMKILFHKMILEIYFNEQNFFVLKSIAENIYRLIKINFANQENSELINVIFKDPQTYSSDQINIFEMNLYIISELIENNFSYLKNKIPDINNIITNSIKLGTNRMKENASRCLGNLLKSCKQNNFELYKELIPLFLQEIKNFSEETITNIFENFCEMNKDSFSNLNNYVESLLNLTFEFLNNKYFSGNTKVIISEFLILLGELNKEIFKKNDCFYLKKTLELGYNFASNSELDLLDNEYPLYDIGERIIESLALLFPSKYVFPLSIEYSKMLLNSTNTNHIRAALLSLGLIAEGCAEKIKQNLEEIINLIVLKFSLENNNNIKSACIISVDRLTEFCWPNILEYQDKIIPMLLYGLSFDDNNDEIISKSLICLKYFCQNQDLDLKSHIGNLLPRLVFLLNHNSINIQRDSLSALASILENADDISNETLHQILESCKCIITMRNSEEENDLRSSALECVSHIAFTIKLANFGNYIQFFTLFAFECVNSKIYEFQDSGFVYLSSLARTIGIQFASELDKLMPIALKVLKDDSGILNSKVNDEFCLDSDSEDEIEENGKIKNIKINDAYIDAKCSAILAINNFAQACPKDFLKYIQEVFSSFDHITNFVDENVNIEVILAYESLLISIDEAEKILSRENNNYNQNITSLAKRAWLNDILPKFEKTLEDTDSKNEIASILESICGIIEHFGKNLFTNENYEKNNQNLIYTNNGSLDRILKILKTLLEYKANCQIKNDDEEDDDDIDHDEEILLGICDIISAISEKLENEFHIIFINLFLNLKKYLNVKRSTEDRSMVFNCLADVFCYCKISIGYFLEELLVIINDNIKKNLKAKDDELFKNISYLIGIIFEGEPVKLKDYLELTVKSLQDIFENSQYMGRDNVIAAFSRIGLSIKINMDYGVIYDKIIDMIFSSIPLKHDFMQNLVVLKYLGFLFENSDRSIFIKYSENFFNFVKFICFNSFKCGVDNEIFKKIKIILEKMNEGSPDFQNNFNMFLLQFKSDEERNKFIGIFQNILT